MSGQIRLRVKALQVATGAELSSFCRDQDDSNSMREAFSGRSLELASEGQVDRVGRGGAIQIDSTHAIANFDTKSRTIHGSTPVTTLRAPKDGHRCKPPMSAKPKLPGLDIYTSATSL
jgi:hypothetical protein